jgi:hypothetical protein
MRILACLLVLLSTGAPGAALSQTPAERPRAAVVVLTLDQVRQVQTRHGLSLLEQLGDERWGRYDIVEAALSAELFEPCRDERVDGRLDYCVRYYLTRAVSPAEAAPTVVVAFDDDPRPANGGRKPGQMQVVCFGRGVVPADPAVQSSWLWPNSALMHGVNDWDRDEDALAACIGAAASEAWTGLRQPDAD